MGLLIKIIKSRLSAEAKRKSNPAKVEAARHERGSSIEHRTSNFNAFLFLFLAFFMGVVLLRPGFLQAVSFSSGGSQTNWHVATSGATAVLPVAASYNVYDSKGAGITAGTDIKLQSTGYTATDDGRRLEGFDVFLTNTLDKRDNFIHKAWYS